MKDYRHLGYHRESLGFYNSREMRYTTVNGSLPIAVRAEVEEAYPIHDASMRLQEPHGGAEGNKEYPIKPESSVTEEKECE